jgi:hypothetical protein
VFLIEGGRPDSLKTPDFLSRAQNTTKQYYCLKCSQQVEGRERGSITTSALGATYTGIKYEVLSLGLLAVKYLPTGLREPRQMTGPCHSSPFPGPTPQGKKLKPTQSGRQKPLQKEELKKQNILNCLLPLALV